MRPARQYGGFKLQVQQGNWEEPAYYALSQHEQLDFGTGKNKRRLISFDETQLAT